MKKFLAVLLGLGSVALIPASIPAATEVVLVDGNAEARLQLDTSAGMYSWVVDGGANQLFTQAFWWRLGDTGPERPLSDLALSTYLQPSPDFVTSTYTHTGGLFRLTLRYDLNGGTVGSGIAQIEESISIDNTSGATLEFHLFQYTDVDLGGAPGGDTAVIGTGGSGFVIAMVSESEFNLAETVSLTPAQRAEADLFDHTLTKLNNADADDLSNALSAGPGDVAFALQWDVVLAASGAGSQLEIVKHKNLTVSSIPEPGAAGLIVLTGLLLGGAKRRRSRS